MERVVNKNQNLEVLPLDEAQVKKRGNSDEERLILEIFWTNFKTYVYILTRLTENIYDPTT